MTNLKQLAAEYHKRAVEIKGMSDQITRIQQRRTSLEQTQVDSENALLKYAKTTGPQYILVGEDKLLVVTAESITYQPVTK